MTICAAVNCSTRSDYRKDRTITLHRFPKDPVLRAKWVKAVRRANWIPIFGSVLCSIHFEDHCFDRSGKRVRLLPGSEPTLFPSYPSYYQKLNLEMAACSAFGCTNRRSKAVPGLSFHRFPSDEPRRSEWIKAVRRKNWIPSKYSNLCSAHFTDASLDRSMKNVLLKPFAVPTIFSFSSHLQKGSHSSNTKMKVDVNCNDSLGYDSNNNPCDDNATVLDETYQDDFKSQEANKLRGPGSCNATDEVSMVCDEINMKDNTNDSLEYYNNNKWKGDIDYTREENKTKGAYKDNTNNTTCEDNSSLINETNQGDITNSTISISDASVSVPQKSQRKQRSKLKKNATKNKNSYNVPKQASCGNITDEFLIFGQHITVQLSKLNLEQAIVLQEDIQQLITEARLGAIESQSWAKNIKKVYKNLSGYLSLSDVQNLKKATENKMSQDHNISKQSSCENVTDEFSMFGQHIATQFSKLPLEQRLILRQNIQKLITEARLRAVES